MKSAILLLLISLTALSNASVSSWEEFKDIYGKMYTNLREELYRQSIFEKNLNDVLKHNELHQAGLKPYSKGINEFSDMTLSELVTELKPQLNVEGSFVYENDNSSNPSGLVDWRVIDGVVTEVKDQRRCGSCWAFSATGSLEGQMKLRKNKIVSLSEQQLVDCSRDFGNHGCDGGLMTRAFQYIKAAGGIESDSTYKYRGWDQGCKYDESKSVAKVSGFKVIRQGDEDALRSAVTNIGPISVGIDATGHFQSYRGGVFVDEYCQTTHLDHGVLVVGYGTDYDTGLDYWLVKNSWGKSWGDAGYIKMARNHDNMCGIATEACFPTV